MTGSERSSDNGSNPDNSSSPDNSNILDSPSNTFPAPAPAPSLLDPQLPPNPSLFPAPAPSTTRPVGNADLSPPGHPITAPSTEGMLIGPTNPLFSSSRDSNRGLNVPPGARFDPIAPEGVGEEPDFDEFVPPGLDRNGLSGLSGLRGRGNGNGRGRGNNRLRGNGRGNNRLRGNGTPFPFDPSGFGNGSSFNPFNGM